MLVATNLILALLPVLQQPQVVEEEVDGGIRVRKELVDVGGQSVLSGVYTATAANGTKLIDGIFTDGLASKRWRYRYPNGDLRMVGTFRAGERSGKWQFRYPGTSVVRAEGKFVDGSPSGAFEFLTPSEEPDPRYSGTYQPVRADWPNGVRRFEGLTLDGLPHGPWTFDWEDGSRMLTGSFDRGAPAGAWRFHHVGGVFDPEFVSAEYPQSFDLLGFFESLPLPGAVVVPLPTDLDPTLLPESLTDFPAAPPAPGVSRLGRAKIEVSIEAFTKHADAADRELELGRLVLWGPATLQVLIDELRAIDWREDSGLARAKLLVEGILTPLLGGRSFGWQWAATDEAWAANRLSFLRTYSYYYLTRDNRAVWGIDLVLPLEQGEKSELLLRPPVGHELLTDRAFTASDTLRRGSALRARGGSGTEQALADGLAWLARHQSPGGAWQAAGFMQAGEGCNCDVRGESLHDLGVTGLALLALMGDGNTLAVGPYAHNLVAGVRWIVSLQDPETGALLYAAPVLRDGKIVHMYGGDFIYDHAVATQALCRALESASSPGLRRAAQKAVDFVARARNPYGAWRYAVPPAGDNDTSVTGWAVAALVAAQRVGLDVDQRAFEGALNWIDEVTDPANGRVGYDSMGSLSARVPGVNDHYPSDKGEAMTAMGLLLRFQLGQVPASEQIMGRHADLLLKTLPEWDPAGNACDMYYWYHGTHAMFHMDGRHWKAWNKAMKKTVLESQRKDDHSLGSWDPVGPWGIAGGRVYATAMMAMCLEIYLDPGYPR